MSAALLFILAACKIRHVGVPDNGGASGRKPDEAGFLTRKLNAEIFIRRFGENRSYWPPQNYSLTP